MGRTYAFIFSVLLAILGFLTQRLAVINFLSTPFFVIAAILFVGGLVGGTGSKYITLVAGVILAIYAGGNISWQNPTAPSAIYQWWPLVIVGLLLFFYGGFSLSGGK